MHHRTKLDQNPCMAITMARLGSRSLAAPAAPDICTAGSIAWTGVDRQATGLPVRRGKAGMSWHTSFMVL
jgi:hypothetical protein